MSDYIEYVSGGAAYDWSNADAAERGLTGIRFPNDGATHKATWHSFVPTTLRSVSDLTMRLVFMAHVTGTAVVDMKLTTTKDDGTLVEYTNNGVAVEITSVVGLPALGTVYIDWVIGSYLDTEVTMLLLEITRDSSASGDDLAGGLTFLNGRTLETQE
jgi:hypothetical protein